MRTQLWQLACLYWTTANLLAFALMGLDITLFSDSHN